MKKSVLFVALILLLLFVFGNIGKNDSRNNESATTSGEVDSAASLKDILLNNGAFLESDSDIPLTIDQMLSTYESNPVYVSRFAVIDLDSDGSSEIILEVEIAPGDVSWYEVLYDSKNGIIGFQYTYRMFTDLKADGTFIDIDDAYSFGIGHIEFDGHSAHVVKTAVCTTELLDEYGTKRDIYEADGQVITKEEFDKLFDFQEMKKDVNWYTFSTENIEKYA